MINVKNIVLGCALSIFASAASADVFTGEAPITNIRQDNSEFVQINHPSVSLNSCATRTYGVMLKTTHPNFKNLYASVLTAKALGVNVQFALYDNQCETGFGLVRVMTMKQ